MTRRTSETDELVNDSIVESEFNYTEIKTNSDYGSDQDYNSDTSTSHSTKFSHENESAMFEFEETTNSTSQNQSNKMEIGLKPKSSWYRGFAFAEESNMDMGERLSTHSLAWVKKGVQKVSVIPGDTRENCDGKIAQSSDRGTAKAKVVHLQRRAGKKKFRKKARTKSQNNVKISTSIKRNRKRDDGFTPMRSTSLPNMHSKPQLSRKKSGNSIIHPESDSEEQNYLVMQYKPVLARAEQSRWVVKTSSKVSEKYQLCEEGGNLGSGTYGVVKSVRHKDTGKGFALKIIKKRYLYDKEEKEMIKREIQIHQVLDHKNIVRLFDIYENTDKLYLVMEKANRGTLEDIINLYQGGLSECEISPVFVQIVDAVVFLHENGVLQGDIKPSNVLITCSQDEDDCVNNDNLETSGCCRKISKLKVKLCDFGLSRKVPDVKYYKHTGDVHKAPYTNFRGTVGYCAPEILSEDAYTIAADIWSLGIILYELIGGVKPFVPYSECLREPVSFPENMWKGRSLECKELILKLLQKDPVQRIKAQEARKDPWFNFVFQ
eukprot:CAMPEP_0204828338 /NCGR_PEP_ID=MMETSP1346-20131115/6052_1 /ASSEMBLY_ACC=CAM_ASM_000771 /TAXON_ID=215587 /ORGANISM="Aplanochytrium stocchinoi, Strain GSBS06" /LENGTH=546 /DNA_ID=CAMNT_0051957327 /DNA_START=540 /DNA_END=2180 /DNA_ORIENTATION=-